MWDVRGTCEQRVRARVALLARAFCWGCAAVCGAAARCVTPSGGDRARRSARGDQARKRAWRGGAPKCALLVQLRQWPHAPNVVLLGAMNILRVHARAPERHSAPSERASTKTRRATHARENAKSTHG
jgi:hypothetical protein